jgi:hypothetical protein
VNHKQETNMIILQKLLEKKVMAQEDQSRMINLVLYDVPEGERKTWEQSKQKVGDIGLERSTQNGRRRDPINQH